MNINPSIKRLNFARRDEAIHVTTPWYEAIAVSDEILKNADESVIKVEHTELMGDVMTITVANGEAKYRLIHDEANDMHYGFLFYSCGGALET